jgi:ATP-dependent Zn protease
MRVKLNLTDNWRGRFMAVGAVPPLREVRLTVTVTMPGVAEPVSVADINLLSDTPQRTLFSRADVYRTTVHEAGHAVANIPHLTRENIDFITVRSAGNFGGYARYDDINPTMGQTREQAIAHIARMLGGREGENAMGLTEGSGWSNDIERASAAALRYITVSRLTSTPAVALRLPTDDKGHVVSSDSLVREEARMLLEAGQELARQQIRAQFPYFRALAGALMTRGHVDRTAIAQIVAETRARVAAAGGEEALPRFQREPRGQACARFLVR